MSYKGNIIKTRGARSILNMRLLFLL